MSMWIWQFLIIQTIFFGVVIFVLRKVLLGDTQSHINRLAQERESSKKKQAESEEKLKLANQELEKRRKEADLLVQKMAQEAEEKAKEEREKIVVKARTESEEIIAKAIKTKDDMRKVVQKETEIKLVDFTIDLLTSVIGEKGKGVLDDHMIGEFLKELEKVDMSMIGLDVKSAEILTAVSIKEQHRNKLNQIIQSKLTREIKIEEKIDSKIVSGAILRFGSLVLDGGLHNAMKEKGIGMKENIEKG